jgi:M6 family metalloprotease-like protein
MTGRLAALSLVAALMTPALATAQDIEARAQISGTPLPAAYYDQIRATPNAYDFSNGLFNRVQIGRTSVRGDVRIPVVLALFSNSAEPHITQDMVQRSLFTGPAERGTMTEAYLQMSQDALEVGGDVFRWVRTSLTIAEVLGLDSGFGSDARIGEYFVEALDSLDGEVDFSLYDSDGPDGIANSGDDDGLVDVITFEYLEVSASCGGPAIWPHRWTLAGQTGRAYATDDLGIDGDTIRIQDYITQSVAQCSGDVVQDAAVITHEFGHALGLPDYYHWVDRSAGPAGRRWVLGCWALMAAGSWGCGPVEDRVPFGPTQMMAFSKFELGWLEFMDVGEVWNEDIVLDPVQTSALALRIPMDDTGTEFFIAEFRGLIGFDHQLPGAGVLMYKQDLQASRRPDPLGNDPYFLSILEQDANNTLLRMGIEGGNRGEIGDAWGVGAGNRKLNAESTPQLRLSDGARTSVMVHDVYIEGDQAHLVISTGRTPRLVAPDAALEVTQIRTFAESLRIAGGTGPYEGVGELPDGLSLEASGDELFLVGSVRDAGPYEYTFSVQDALGQRSDEVSVALSAPTTWAVSLEALLQRFLQAGLDPLTPGELAYLDDFGNTNGSYDVGDLRKWLREGAPPVP